MQIKKGDRKMKAEYVNPFLEAFDNVIQQIMSVKVEKGNLYIKEGTQKGQDVIISIGVVGDLTGNIIMNMSETTAKDIASKMMYGMEVKTLDDMAKSAIAELGNMVAGNATAYFSKMGVNINITPPNMFAGKDITIYTYKVRTICVPLIVAGDVVEIDVALS